MDYEAIGQKIASRRKLLGISQEKLAEKVNSSANYISNLERNKRHPSLEFLVKVANILNMSVDYLLAENLTNKEIIDNAILKESICLLETIDKDKRKEFLLYVEGIAEIYYKIKKTEK